jgi:2-desacetyl-2-hydroxyethyl bacteriochlorophyllide A dehydrogenase
VWQNRVRYHAAVQAVRLLRPGTPLQNQTLKDPTPAAGEVVVDVIAAGICHSDAHYRAGDGRVALPLTLGHEIAGIISEVGEEVEHLQAGDRVALHYLIACGQCHACRHSGEQFCATGQMIGKDRDGGYAQYIVVPARNAVLVPEEVSLEQAAIMMCSTATAFHALRLSALRQGESLAILGFGGVGVSAVQLAGTLDAGEVFVADLVREKLALAETYGAMPIDAMRTDVGEALLRNTGGRGVDVVLELTGNARAATSALNALAPGGRLMIVAINLRSMTLDPYADLLSRERRIIGCSDHTREEIVELLDLARRGEIDLSHAVTRTVPLEADSVNQVLDELETGTAHLRSVIVNE